jgi:hypothetical protein
MLGKTFRELQNSQTLLEDATEAVISERRLKQTLLLAVVMLVLFVLFWAAYFVLSSTTPLPVRDPVTRAAMAAKNMRHQL